MAENDVSFIGLQIGRAWNPLLKLLITSLKRRQSYGFEFPLPSIPFLLILFHQLGESESVWLGWPDHFADAGLSPSEFLTFSHFFNFINELVDIPVSVIVFKWQSVPLVSFVFESYRQFPTALMEQAQLPLAHILAYHRPQLFKVNPSEVVADFSDSADWVHVLVKPLKFYVWAQNARLYQFRQARIQGTSEGYLEGCRIYHNLIIHVDIAAALFWADWVSRELPVPSLILVSQPWSVESAVILRGRSIWLWLEGSLLVGGDRFVEFMPFN